MSLSIRSAYPKLRYERRRISLYLQRVAPESLLMKQFLIAVGILSILLAA